MEEMNKNEVVTVKNDGNDMLKRVITGAFIVLAVSGAFVLRQCVKDAALGRILFDIMFYVFSIVGTIEMLLTIKDKTNFFEKAVVAVFAAAYFPTIEFVGMRAGMLLLATAAGLIFCDYVFSFEKKTNESTGLSLIALFYPTVLLTAGHYINQRIGTNVLILLFVISPFSDSGALFVGALCKGKKLCPKISPKKTVSGAIGGLIGGLIGAVLVWVIFTRHNLTTLAIYALAGLLGSVATQFGDLVEGAMKRKFGIKDFGKILPGHGGMLDRIDGLMFNAVFMTVFFGLISIVF